MNGLRNFSIAIKTIERAKKKTMFQRTMEGFKGIRIIRINSVQLPRYCFYKSMCVAQFPHLYWGAFKCVPKFSLK